MSEVKVNKLSPRSGTTVTLGDSGDTITIPSGVTFDASSGGLAGTLTTAAQPNITSVGTLSSLNVDASAGTGVIGITLDAGAVNTSKDSSSFRTHLSMSNTTGVVGRLDTASNDLFLRFADDLAFQSTAGSEYMRIDSSGNVGIGTSSPSARVNILESTVGTDPTSDSSNFIKLTNNDIGTVNEVFGIGFSSLSGSTDYLGAFIQAEGNYNLNFNHSLIFGTRGTSGNATERMRIDSSGNVFITGGGGTYNDITDDGKGLIVGTGSVDNAGIVIRTSASGTSRIYFADNSGSDDDRKQGFITYNQTNKFMAFGTDHTERMRIDSSGNVGIGGTPTNDSAHKSLALFGASGTGAGLIKFNDTSGNADGLIFADDGNLFITADYDNTTASSTIRFRVDGSSEKMRIDSSGNVLVNSTSNTGIAAKLFVKGTYGIGTGYGTASSEYRVMYMDNGDGTLYFHNGSNFAYLSTAGAWTNASDERIKNNIVDIKYGLDAVLNTQPRSYKMNDVEGDFIGFVAQELQTVIPEVVSGNPEKQLGVDYGSLVAVAFKAIQEQQTKIQELEARITQLENA